MRVAVGVAVSPTVGVIVMVSSGLGVHVGVGSTPTEGVLVGKTGVHVGNTCVAVAVDVGNAVSVAVGVGVDDGTGVTVDVGVCV